MDVAHSKNHQAYHKIKHYITNMNVLPATAIPVLELSDRLFISVTPVREAMMRLYAEGLVDLVPNRGFYTRNISIKELIDYHETVFWTIIAFLDTSNTALIANAANALVQADQGMKDDPGRYSPEVNETFLNMTEAFWRCLISHTSNSVVTDLMERFLDRTRFLRAHQLSQPKGRELILGFTIALASHLSKGNPRAAKRLLKRELEDTSRSIAGIVRERVAQAIIA